MDNFVTAPFPKKSGRTINLRVRLDRQRAYQYAKVYNVDAAVLAMTSVYFRAAVLEGCEGPDPMLDIVWPDIDAVEGYLLWLEDSIVYSKPVKESSPPRKLVKAAESAHSHGAEQEKEDFRTLIGLWLFGNSIQDMFFKDIIISLLEWMIKEPNASDRFVSVLTPAIVKAVWETADARLKLCRFIVDMIGRYASHETMNTFLARNAYLPSFQADLAARLIHSYHLHQLPSGTRAPDADFARVLFPYPSYRPETIGRGTTEVAVPSPWPPFGNIQKRPPVPAHAINELNSVKLQRLARSALEDGEDVGMCRYHEHGKNMICWWELAREVEKSGIEQTAPA